jgi:hypothetical protein
MLIQVEAVTLPKEVHIPEEEAASIPPPALNPRDLWLRKCHRALSLDQLDPRLKGVRIYNRNGGILPPPEDGLGVAEFRSIFLILFIYF